MIPLLVAAALSGPALAASHIDGAVTVQVDDRENAIRTVITQAGAAGGWFSNLSDDAVTVQVPVDKAATFIEGAKALGVVVDRSWGVQEYDTELIDLNARLSSRNAVLERYLEILGTTNADSVVAVERQITTTVAEIEQIQGRIHQLDHLSAYARLTWNFRFRDRAAPVRDGTSSFAWINTLNLADLQDAFRSGQLLHHTGGAQVPSPDGFAPGRHHAHTFAVSPDDIVFRVRTAKNKPVADLAFCKEAMRTRMKDAGYHVVGESDIAAGALPGALIELSAPDGQQDDTYLIAIFVDGKRILVAEAAGEAGRFQARREAILAAIRSIEP